MVEQGEIVTDDLEGSGWTVRKILFTGMVIQNWNTQQGTERYLFLEVFKTLLGKAIADVTLSNGILPVYLLLFISSYATKFHKNSQSRNPKITKIRVFRFFYVCYS